MAFLKFLLYIIGFHLGLCQWQNIVPWGYEAPNYGQQGVPSPSNRPGGRAYAASGTDSKGNLWMFGGGGFDATGRYENMNDLWRFDGSNWTWISGSSVGTPAGYYGTKGVTSSLNSPPGRIDASMIIDKQDTIWIFGGRREVIADSIAYNDLWKFDGFNWTWVSGSNTTNQNGVSGPKGQSSESYYPGGRFATAGWSDSQGNLWIFGGAAFNWYTIYSELWKFDGRNWTWVTGGYNDGSTVGTPGMTSPTNSPGARYWHSALKDSDGTIWIFGGSTYDCDLSDLWIFDGQYWALMAGPTNCYYAGSYGPQGVASYSNYPAARGATFSWIDSKGNKYFFGGYPSVGIPFHDFWKLDMGRRWTWMDQTDPLYPRFAGVSWLNKNDDSLWLFGGADNYANFFNDVWKYNTRPPTITTGSVTSGPMTTGLMTTGSMTSGAATSGSATSGAITSGPLTSNAVTSQFLTTGTSPSLTTSNQNLLTSGENLSSGSLTSSVITTEEQSLTEITTGMEATTSSEEVSNEARTFKNATIGLASSLGVVALVAVIAITFLLIRTKNQKRNEVELSTI